MDEKELAGWFGKLGLFTQSPLDYPRISVDPAIEGGDITVTRRVTEMPETFWDHSGWDMNLDNMDALAEIATKMMGDIYKERTQTDLERLLSKKKPTVAESLYLYKRGLKPYFVSVKENMLVELTMENESDRTIYDITAPIKWFHPKIAEKIQARYQEMNDLVQKKGAAIRECDSQIEELKLRISMIEEGGTDLII
jgi:hypothetical protein